MKTKAQLLKQFEKLKAPKRNKRCNINCDFCKSCDFCNFCKSCIFCNFCLRLYNGILCKGLRFECNEKNAYNNNKYWVLNKKVSKKEFKKVKKIMEKK